ncbi:hypothetical protein FC19_GL000593 [Liquorilactobacillus aquaticus DSM 21051]|uniref:Uncharacterized protein n=1 Tax=Liquorilactobacillus aquaticus DSM 21051 TaxID=1423725 RepID=A0A0R2CYC1_9LACO|nr:hypothetical protein [Liquorilactobacillus aquaticus]KRM96306.1 hypothetical protein FC19_GL000593 [Liquorilactobacillus aquaticus DSM 21051]
MDLYTANTHQQETELLSVGDENKALCYEIADMQNYIEPVHNDEQLALSHGIAHILDSVRTTWGVKFPSYSKLLKLDYLNLLYTLVRYSL